MSRLVRIILGSLLLLLGLVGLVLPILQGWLFLAVGGFLLVREVPFLRRFVEKLKTRFPQIERVSKRLKDAVRGRR